jgi:hypothetical protein
MQEIAPSAHLYGDAHGRALEPGAYKHLKSWDGALVYPSNPRDLTRKFTRQVHDSRKDPDHLNRFPALV